MEKREEITAQWAAVKGRLEKYVVSLVKDEATANDIMQEAFIKAYSRIETLKDPDKFPQWVFSIARNEANTFFNNQKRNREIYYDAPDETQLVYNNNGIESCVTHFLKKLPKKYGEALQLVEMENVPQTELAERLNISYSGAKSRIQRGRGKLKQLFTKCCDIAHDRYGNITDYIPKAGGYCSTRCR